MFKRSLLISTLALCASLSFSPAQAEPALGEVKSLSVCSSECVSQAQGLANAIEAMPAGAAKDKLLLALISAIGTLAIETPALSKDLGGIAASAAKGLSDAQAAAMPFVNSVVASLQAGNPGDATASVGNVRDFGDNLGS